MKALRFHQTGDISQIHIEEVANPVPNATEVLVKVKAAGINPSDIKNVLGLMEGTTAPRIPGRDFSGVVASGPKAGLEVFGSGGKLGIAQDGTHAEYVLVPENALVSKPQALSFEAAASIGVPWITAWSAIIDIGQVKAEENVLIIGVNGAVGRAAAQIAKSRGARVIGTVRTAGDDRPKPYVDALISLEDQDLAVAVFDHTARKGANLILDTIGGPFFQSGLKSLAHKGLQIAITSTEPQVSFNLVDFYRREGRLFGLDTMKLTIEECSAILNQIVPLFAKEEVDAQMVETCSLEQAPEIYEKLYHGGVKGKYVIRFN